jgi:hypothetical protein
MTSVRTQARVPVMYLPTTDAPVVHHSVFVIHHGHMLTVYAVYLRAKIGVVYGAADVYAIGIFIDLRSDSVCMQSRSYFPNPREFFCVKNIFIPFIAHIIFPQVCFVHNFCNLTDTANPRWLESIIFHPRPNNDNLGNNAINV